MKSVTKCIKALPIARMIISFSMAFRREGRYGSKPFQCDDETFPGVQRLLPAGLLISTDTAKCGLVTNTVS
jgi:hypothetical protein